MESLQKPVTLTQDVVRVLDEIRTGADNALYCAKPDVSEELFAKHIVSLVEGAGLPVLQTMHYRWYLRELARLWRTRTGRDLAFHIELCIRKWVGLGLEPGTLQFLVTEAHERLKAQSHTTKTPSHEEEAPGSTRVPSPRPLAPSSQDRVPSPGDETAKVAKSAKAEESVHAGFDARMCQPMAGPRPQAEPAPAADEQEQQ